jgi:nondiscriminating glutamyl-tRNA synthetase
MGGARTALFNWLFARHEGGRFILRIEDTDAARSSDELEAHLLDDLSWLGLTWDEGPRIGGEYGPYRQSERIDVYQGWIDRLVARGKAYPCFCSDEELARRKAERVEAGLPPHYDGRCRDLDERGRETRRGAGAPESIRFIVSGENGRRLDDEIRGEVEFPPGMVGDFVIMRSNGLPTYNFAVTVDDALMRITHVIRGEEHLSNTLRQLMLYEALGFDTPRFAHIPLILGPDRTKLSKRHGAPNVGDFHERGYPPEAVVNYLAFLGWSPADTRELFTIEELIDVFTIERVSQSPSMFDEAKLDWVSEQHVRAGGSTRYFDIAAPYFGERFASVYTREQLREIFDIVSERLPSFSLIPREAAAFAPGPPSPDGEAARLVAGREELLAAFADAFASCGWDADAIRGAIKNVGKERGVKGKELYMPLRAAVTGMLHGPDLVSIIRIRGRDDVLDSLRSAAGSAGEGEA